VWATSDGPRLEDFGITAEDLEQAPSPVLSKHRVVWVAVAYLLIAGVIFTQILRVSHSLPAAAFFTIIALAAGSVLLLPALVLVLCVGERAEEKWLCRRVPVLAACVAYRRALAAHSRTGRAPASAPDAGRGWKSLSHQAAVELVGGELDRRYGSRVASVDRESTGVDFVVELEDRLLLVRCEPGPRPVEPGVGRELVAAVADFRADSAVVLTASGATPALRRYISGRPIEIVAPADLDRAVAEAVRSSAPGPSSP
jgi:hypothetical protein